MDIDFGFGHVFHGAPLEIVRQMKAVAEGADELDLGEYIDWVVERAATVEGVVLRVGCGPLHARAKTLLDELVAAHFVRDLHDDLDEPEDERPTARWPATRDIAALDWRR